MEGELLGVAVSYSEKEQKEVLPDFVKGCRDNVRLARLLDYLCAEILELGGKQTLAAGKRTLTRQHLLRGIATDVEMMDMFTKMQQ